MKINIDLSNTELSHALSSFKHDAQELVELRNAVASKSDEVWKLRNEKGTMEGELQYVKSDLDYYKAELRRTSDENNRLRSQVGTANFNETEIPQHTMQEMGNLLNLVRKATTDVDAKFLATLVSACKSNAKIQMIKAVRQSCGCGLKEAKDLVEAIAFDESYSGGRFYSTEIADVIENART